MFPSRHNFRDRSNYVAAVASELAAPLLRRIARHFAPEAPTPPSAWRSGVIVGNGHIGDVLYRTCALDTLARGLPECRWSYLTTELGREVLRDNPALYDVLPWMSSAEPSSVGSAHVRALQQRKYDVVLCSESVRHHTALALAVRMGAPNRVAFGHKGLSGLITMPIQLPHPMPWPAQFREMAAGVTGIRTTDPLRPRVFLSEADRRAAAQEWNRLGYTARSSVLACSLTTKQRVGQIPLTFLRDVLRAVLERDPDIQIALCGTLEDGQTLRSVADALGPRASLSVGALPLLPYAAFLARCRGFFGRDSGPRHLANAVSIPVLFIRNLGTSAMETGRYCETEWDLAPDGEYLDEDEIAVRLTALDPRKLADQIILRTNVRT